MSHEPDPSPRSVLMMFIACAAVAALMWAGIIAGMWWLIDAVIGGVNQP